MFIGVVGKPNAGKSTFFAGATLVDAKVAPFPFTTIDANRGKAYVRGKCPCKGLNRECKPKNSLCEDGIRLIPLELVDVAGLVPEAHLGRGLGLKFLDDLRSADALIQVVDVSGKTDLEGNAAENFDPVREVEFLVKEIEFWIASILNRGMNKVRGRGIDELAELLSGLKVNRTQIERACRNVGLSLERISWTEEDILKFSIEIRNVSKPIAIAANKIDTGKGKENYDGLVERFPDLVIVPTCAEAELALRRANEKGIVKYTPGADDFQIVGGESKQKEALQKIKEIIKKNGGTGVQKTIDSVVFDLLEMIIVYPVEDENRFSDHFGNVLPDGYLLVKGSTCSDLAGKIHTDLQKKFICGIDARKKMKVGKNQELKDGDIIKIVANR